MLSHTDRDNT